MNFYPWIGWKRGDEFGHLRLLTHHTTKKKEDDWSDGGSVVSCKMLRWLLQTLIIHGGVVSTNLFFGGKCSMVEIPTIFFGGRSLRFKKSTYSWHQLRSLEPKTKVRSLKDGEKNPVQFSGPTYPKPNFFTFGILWAIHKMVHQKKY